jgi:hypothetical protein
LETCGGAATAGDDGLDGIDFLAQYDGMDEGEPDFAAGDGDVLVVLLAVVLDEALRVSLILCK